MGARRLMAKEKVEGGSVYSYTQTHTHTSPQIVFSLCSWHKVKAVDLQLFSHSKNLRRYRLKASEQKVEINVKREQEYNVLTPS